MKFSNLEEDKVKDKIELSKQQQAETQKILHSRKSIHKNHVLYEVNVKEKTISLAEFKPPKTLIHWFEAVEMKTKKKVNKINLFEPNFEAKPITKSDVIIKENCIYVNALNVKNCKKILKRDYGLEV